MPGPRDPWCRCRVPRAGRTGCRSRILRRLAKTGWRAHLATRTCRGELAAVTPYLSQCPEQVRGGERGVMGAPRSHRPRDRSPRHRRLMRASPARVVRTESTMEARRKTGCYGSSTPPTSISAPVTTTSASRRPPSGNASSPPSGPPSTWPSPSKVDLVLIAGDLFDSNVQPRRSVERVAAELGRLVAARIRTVIIPGTHDVYDRASIYRAYDLKALAGSAPDDDLVTVLTPERPMVHLAALDDHRARPGVRDQARPGQPAQGPRRRGRSAPTPRGGSGWSTARSRSRARPTATRSSSPPTRSPRADSTTSRSGTGTPSSRARPAA